MVVRRALILAGSLWEAVRFFIVLSLLARLYYDAGSGPGIVAWLLLGGSGNVLVAVGGFMLCMFPRKYGELIGLLRLGKILSVFSFFLITASGAAGISAHEMVFWLGRFSLTEGVLLPIIFVLDLAFLVVLLAWRGEKRPTFPAATQQ